MTTLGIDASTKCTGYAVFRDGELIDYGKVSSDKDNWRERVVFMMKEVARLAKEYSADEIVAEVPVRTLANVNTLEQLFSLHGALLGISAVLHIRFVPIEVNSWRKKLGLLKDIPKSTKDKRAILKERSIKMANELYGLELVWKSASSKYNDDDISDAILIAHTYIMDREVS